MKYDSDIFDAVEFGDLETIRTYWTDEIDIDWQDLNGMDLIMTACCYGHEKIVRHLLAFRPKLTKHNKGGQTALDIAMEANHLSIVDLIRDAMLNNK